MFSFLHPTCAPKLINKNTYLIYSTENFSISWGQNKSIHTYIKLNKPNYHALIFSNKELFRKGLIINNDIIYDKEELVIDMVNINQVPNAPGAEYLWGYKGHIRIEKGDVLARLVLIKNLSMRLPLTLKLESSLVSRLPPRPRSRNLFARTAGTFRRILLPISLRSGLALILLTVADEMYR